MAGKFDDDVWDVWDGGVRKPMDKPAKLLKPNPKTQHQNIKTTEAHKDKPAKLFKT